MSARHGIADRIVLLLSLIPYLRDNGPTTVAELAREFEASEKTIRELVAFLGTAGVPGETLTYQPEDLFDIDWDAFELHDTVALTQVVAIEDTPRFAPAEHAALIAGLHVLTQMLPESQQRIGLEAAKKLALAAPDVHEAPVTVSAAPPDPRVLTVSEALTTSRRLRFEYSNLNGQKSRREVEPISLVQDSGEWYLRAFCLDRQSERTFRIESMTNVAIGDELAHSRGTTADGATAGAAGGAEPSVARPIRPAETALVATVRIRSHALYRIAGYAPAVTQLHEGGWISATVGLVHPTAAVRLVQQAPGEIIVESPAAAREAVRDWAERAHARVAGGSAGTETSATES